jgi:hypothetical protein
LCASGLGDRRSDARARNDLKVIPSFQAHFAPPNFRPVLRL